MTTSKNYFDILFHNISSIHSADKMQDKHEKIYEKFFWNSHSYNSKSQIFVKRWNAAYEFLNPNIF